jgi:hypothetical protein
MLSPTVPQLYGTKRNLFPRFCSFAMSRGKHVHGESSLRRAHSRPSNGLFHSNHFCLFQIHLIINAVLSAHLQYFCANGLRLLQSHEP